jgi:predicted anti-sigma-YlaC factor YlaD
MDHLRFEAMLFDPPQAASEDHAVLESHLAGCSACRALALVIGPMEKRLKGAAIVMPVGGFTQRFEARLATKRRKTQERLLYMAVLTIAAGLVALAILFGGELLSALSPYLSSGLKSLGQVMRIGSMLGLLGDFLTVLIESVVGTLSPAYLLAASLAFSALLTLWVLSLYRFNYQTIRREKIS